MPLESIASNCWSFFAIYYNFSEPRCAYKFTRQYYREEIIYNNHRKWKRNRMRQKMALLISSLSNSYIVLSRIKAETTVNSTKLKKAFTINSFSPRCEKLNHACVCPTTQFESRWKPEEIFSTSLWCWLFQFSISIGNLENLSFLFWTWPFSTKKGFDGW